MVKTPALTLPDVAPRSATACLEITGLLRHAAHWRDTRAARLSMTLGSLGLRLVGRAETFWRKTGRLIYVGRHVGR